MWKYSYCESNPACTTFGFGHLAKVCRSHHLFVLIVFLNFFTILTGHRSVSNHNFIYDKFWNTNSLSSREKSYNIHASTPVAYFFHDQGICLRWCYKTNIINKIKTLTRFADTSKWSKNCEKLRKKNQNKKTLGKTPNSI